MSSLNPPSAPSHYDYELLRAQYQEANETHNVDLVRDLNALGMTPVAPSFSGPSIVSPFMDIATKHDIILNFLRELRQTNKLLTEREFQLLPEKSWVQKYDLGRMLGSEHLTQKIAENHFTHMKVPDSKVVICEDKDSLNVKGHQYEGLYEIHCDRQIRTCAEEITEVKRTLSRNEIDELIEVIAAANFTDLNLDNIIVAEDGIYFVDTEFKSFRGPILWGKMCRFESLINEEDKAYFWGKIEEITSLPKPISKIDDYGFLTSVLEDLKCTPDSSEKLIQKSEKTILNLEYVGAKKAGHSSYRPNQFSFNLRDILS